jgi:hypothetical protein
MRRAIDVVGQRQGHQAVCQLYKHHIKPQTGAGIVGRVIWETVDREGRAAMRKLFHGPLLIDFAEQVWLRDPTTDTMVRYAPAVWKAHLKDLFCPLSQAPDGSWSKSTERLNDTQYCDFITACQGYGVVDCDVTFSEQET